MASKVAIAIMREAAFKRLDLAIADISKRLGVAAPELPQQGRDADLLYAQQIEALAVWAENAVEQTTAVVADSPDYELMTVSELKALATERGIDFESAVRKGKIVEAMLEYDAKVAED